MPLCFREINLHEVTTKNDVDTGRLKADCILENSKNQSRKSIGQDNQILRRDKRQNLILQLSRRQLHSSNNRSAKIISSPSERKPIKPLALNRNQEKLLKDTMKEICNEEVARAAKRRKVMTVASVTEPESQCYHHRTNATHHVFREKEYNGDIHLNNAPNHDEMFSHADIAQIIATPGGLVTAWNDAFSTMTGMPNQSHKSKRPLTIFELIEHRSLHNLYGMLAIALHGVNIAEIEMFSIVEDSVSAACGEVKSTYLTITLPCKPLFQSSVPHNITIIFLDDTRPSNRCFLGIITRSTPLYYESFNVPPLCQIESKTTCRNDFKQNTTSTVNVIEEDEVLLKSPPVPFEKVIRLDDDSLCDLFYPEQNMYFPSPLD